MKKLLATISILALNACMSSGVKVDTSRLSRLHKGETTYSEAVQILGRPSQVTALPNGQRMAQYIWISVQSRPESFIPIAGAFIGGADSENTSVTLMFDKDDVLQSTFSSEGSSGTGRGFSGYSQPRKSLKPDSGE
jgi:hypothetical protein